MPTRKPVVAGQFYCINKERLLKQIEECFTNPQGPGKLPVAGARSGKKNLFGVIAPHAGYMFSGAGQAWCYKEIGEAEFPDVYVILGVNHASQETCSSNDDWETPLGLAECDRELAKKMQDEGLPINNLAHRYEHSIEVQIPFLQFVSKDNEKKLRILPIMIADDKHAKWADVIEKSITALKRKAIVICSSDFTHYGKNYGYLPFTDPKKNLRPFDKKATDKITENDIEGFVEFCRLNEATICGRHGIGVLMDLAQRKKAKGEVLKYYTSGDVLDDYSNAVGYASIMWR